LKHPPSVDAFDRYLRATGTVAEPITKLFRITPVQYANLKSLFTIGGKTFELTANVQIWPCMLKELIGGKWGTNTYYLFQSSTTFGVDGWMQWQCLVACVPLSCVSVFFLLFSSLALHHAGSIDAGTWFGPLV
jgi:hypothetical protein